MRNLIQTTNRKIYSSLSISLILLFSRFEEHFVYSTNVVPYVEVDSTQNFTDKTLVVNENTLFLANIKAPETCPNPSLWFSNNADLSDSFPALLEDGRNATFENINPESAYIVLSNETGDSFIEIPYFGIRSSNAQEICLITKLPDITNVQFKYNRYEDELVIVRLPKCCKLNEFYTIEDEMKATTTICKTQSETETESTIDFQILEHNDTHIINEPLNSSLYLIEPYFHFPCKTNSKYKLFNNETYFLKNGSLYVKYDNELASLDDFCIERFEGEYSVFHCYEEEITRSSLGQDIFKSSLILSLIFVIFIIIFYLTIPELREPINWNTCGYAVCLLFSIIILLYSTFDESSNDADNINKILARIYYCMLFTSLYYFTAMNCELYFDVKFYAKTHPYSGVKRISLYVAISVVLFAICCIAHFTANSLVQLPVYVIYNDMDIEPNVSQGVIITYVLHFIMLLSNVFILGLIYWKINAANSNTNSNSKRYWIVLKQKLTMSCRANTLLFFLILVHLISEFITYFYEVGIEFFVLYAFHALHGTMFALIYLWRSEIYDGIKQIFCRKKNPRQDRHKRQTTNLQNREDRIKFNTPMTEIPLVEKAERRYSDFD